MVKGHNELTGGFARDGIVARLMAATEIIANHSADRVSAVSAATITVEDIEGGIADHVPGILEAVKDYVGQIRDMNRVDPSNPAPRYTHPNYLEHNEILAGCGLSEF